MPGILVREKRGLNKASMNRIRWVGGKIYTTNLPGVISNISWDISITSEADKCVCWMAVESCGLLTDDNTISS